MIVKFKIYIFVNLYIELEKEKLNIYSIMKNNIVFFF